MRQSEKKINLFFSLCHSNWKYPWFLLLCNVICVLCNSLLSVNFVTAEKKNQIVFFLVSLKLEISMVFATV